jgi:beta-glucosidase
MKRIGIKAYRFSISWPRIFPTGRKKINERGIDFYDRLIDELLKNGIIPFVTIYHWDLPASLQDLGGWANKDIVNWFTDYANLLYEKYGDRIKNWITLNEPWITAFTGHMYGVHAPGIKNIYTAFKVMHNQILAHTSAVRAFRNSKIRGKIGIALSNRSQKPASQNPEDIEAAKNAHIWRNYPFFLNPVFKGKYHDRLIEMAKEYLPERYEEDAEKMQEPIDFVGINYYSGGLVKHDKKSLFEFKFLKRGLEETEMGWEIYPEGLLDILTNLQKDYSPKEIFITENGAAFSDKLENGEIHDTERINFLKSHFDKASKAIENGIRLRGYFVWSLLDNFEWAEGYSKRFGIVYVDYKTQKRIIKDSGKWYSKIIKETGL